MAEKVSKKDTAERILAAAARLFLTEGFSSISTNRLCKEANTSKSSIYTHFGDMSGVFIALVKREGVIFDLKLDEQPTTREEFLDALIGYGERLMQLQNQPLCVQLDRMMHQEARTNHTLTQSFYASAYGQTLGLITDFIERAKNQGFVQIDLPSEHVADYLVSMWEGRAQLRVRLGLTDRPFEKPRERSAQCVQLLFGSSLGPQ